MKNRLILKNHISEICKLTDAVVAFGKEKELPEDVIYDVNLALEEIVSNIIFHGYESDQQEQIHIAMDLKDEVLALEVKDNAKPFNPLESPDPHIAVPLEEREIGGMGIYLARNVMDELQYRRSEGQNILVMEKNITRPVIQESSADG